MRQNIVRTILFSVAGVLLVAGIVVAALLLWPTPRDPEQNATLAAPAEVVENTASDETTPKPEPQPEQKPAPEETPAAAPAEDEKKEPVDPLTIHRFWETVPEMSLEEAIPIVEKKLTRMEEPLTDKERMALYVWSFAYLKSHWDSDADNHDKSGRILEIATDPACSDKEAQKIFEQFPWKSDTLHGFGEITFRNANYMIVLYGLPKLNVPKSNQKYNGNMGSMAVLEWDTVGSCSISFEMYRGTPDHLRRTLYKEAPLQELVRHLCSLELVRFVAPDNWYPFEAASYMLEDTYIFGEKIF